MPESCRLRVSEGSRAASFVPLGVGSWDHGVVNAQPDRHRRYAEQFRRPETEELDIVATAIEREYQLKTALKSRRHLPWKLLPLAVSHPNPTTLSGRHGIGWPLMRGMESCTACILIFLWEILNHLLMTSVLMSNALLDLSSEPTHLCCAIAIALDQHQLKSGISTSHPRHSPPRYHDL